MQLQLEPCSGVLGPAGSCTVSVSATSGSFEGSHQPLLVALGLVQQLLLAPLGARPRRQLRVLDLLDRHPPQCSPQLWSVVLAWRSLEALRRLVLRLLAAERSNAPNVGVVAILKETPP